MSLTSDAITSGIFDTSHDSSWVNWCQAHSFGKSEFV